MKLKNVSPFERHVEKVILGLGIALALVVYYLFVSGKPYEVTIEQRGPTRNLITEEISPETVEDLIDQRVSQLQNRIGPGSEAFPQPLPVLPYTELFSERLARSLLPSQQTLRVALNQPGVDKSYIDVVEDTLQPYFVPQPPAPMQLTYSRAYGVIGDLAHIAEARQREAVLNRLVQMVGPSVPRDVRVVTIGATYDLADWRRRLQEAPPAGTTRIPEDKWRGAMLITDVVLYRQTFNPMTGKWGPTELIDALPVPPDMRSTHDKRVWPEPEIQAIWTLLQQSQQKIRRPDVQDVVAGQWTPPSEPAVAGVQPGGNVGAEQIRIWAHDITAKPGMTYRYQLKAYVVNPLFQMRPMLQEQAEQLQNRLSLESEASMWTDPIRTDEAKYFFADQITRTPLQASFVVYYLFDGQWRTHTFSKLEPGESIGGVITRRLGDRDVEVNLDMNAMLVDIDLGDRANFVGADARVIYLDSRDGQLRARVVGRDRQDSKRLELDRQAADGAAVASSD